MDRIRLDMHMHTEYSRDSRVALASFAELARKAELGAVCITDHDTIEGGLRLREMNTGLQVIVGEEITTADGELVGLYLEKRVAPGLTADHTIDLIHEQGGLAYVPHPFSRNRRRHLRRPVLERVAPMLDVVEVFNARDLTVGVDRKGLGRRDLDDFSTQHSGRPAGTAGVPDGRHPSEEVEPSFSREDRHVEQAVGHVRLRHDWQRPPVVRAVDDEDLKHTMALCLSVDGDVNAMRVRRGPAHDAPERGPPPSPLRQSRGAEHVRVDPDAARFEEHLSRDLADVRTLYLSLGDDPRGVDRLERDPEAVRDIHVASERKDSQRRVGA